MKHIYSFMMLVLFLLTGTSCEDDYRNMVLFSGDKPIYQTGTCDNLASSVSLYVQSEIDYTVLGIDGGDGAYTVTCSDKAVATVEMQPKSDGYYRLKVTRKSMGKALVTVKDGSGMSCDLNVTVGELKYTWSVIKVGIAIKGTVTDAKKAEIEAAFEATHPVKVGGRYELYPNSLSITNELQAGRLMVYPDGKTSLAMGGSYELKPTTFEGKDVMGYYLSYNNKEYTYIRVMGGVLSTRDTGPMRMDMLEDVTAECPVALPEGVKVFRVERIETR